MGAEKWIRTFHNVNLKCFEWRSVAHFVYAMCQGTYFCLQIHSFSVFLFWGFGWSLAQLHYWNNGDSSWQSKIACSIYSWKSRWVSLYLCVYVFDWFNFESFDLGWWVLQVVFHFSKTLWRLYMSCWVELPLWQARIGCLFCVYVTLVNCFEIVMTILICLHFFSCWPYISYQKGITSFAYGSLLCLYSVNHCMIFHLSLSCCHEPKWNWPWFV